jgi:hypothetical protein
MFRETTSSEILVATLPTVVAVEKIVDQWNSVICCSVFGGAHPKNPS